MAFIAVIPAGGKGLRSGLSIPKQFYKIHGKELICHTLEVFQYNDNIDKIIICAPEEYFPLLENCKKTYNFNKIAAIIEGGNQRQDSVYNALKGWIYNEDDFVVVHDAARPLLSVKALNNVIYKAKQTSNGVLAVKARDTLAGGDTIIKSYMDREGMFYIQTPQVFRYKDIKRAFDKAYEENFYGTDESMLVHRIGIKVNLVEGSYLNFKITSPEDLIIFEKLL
jgi:2-C-methyl-D-erythritol 4-phosphate cytidylyltransferase